MSQTPPQPHLSHRQFNLLSLIQRKNGVFAACDLGGSKVRKLAAYLCMVGHLSADAVGNLTVTPAGTEMLNTATRPPVTVDRMTERRQRRLKERDARRLGIYRQPSPSLDAIAREAADRGFYDPANDAIISEDPEEAEQEARTRAY